jgi:hypothetical protein
VDCSDIGFIRSISRKKHRGYNLSNGKTRLMLLTTSEEVSIFTASRMFAVEEVEFIYNKNIV